MDRMASVNVTASRPAVRQQAGHIFVRFLLFYPLGAKRLDHHLKQALGNLQCVPPAAPSTLYASHPLSARPHLCREDT